MADSLRTLEQQRDVILRQIQQLGDMRRGSLIEHYLQCGKASCACKRAGHPGHGPYFTLTRKVGGKTQTRQFRPGPRLEKVRGEVEAFHRFRELSEQLIELNEAICEQRPVEAEEVRKTSWRRSSRKSGRRLTES